MEAGRAGGGWGCGSFLLTMKYVLGRGASTTQCVATRPVSSTWEVETRR